MDIGLGGEGGGVGNVGRKVYCCRRAISGKVVFWMSLGDEDGECISVYLCLMYFMSLGDEGGECISVYPRLMYFGGERGCLKEFQ